MTKSKRQKIALLALLQKRFGQVECERKFDWINTHAKKLSPSDYPADYKAIIKALCGYRNKIEFCNVRRCDIKLRCDFVIEKRKLIIEYDERQHFTAARKIALQRYPANVVLHYSKSDWIKYCDEIDAHDNDPPCRDERRAFYDSIRDIEAFRNGWTLLRIKCGDINWETANIKILNNFLN